MNIEGRILVTSSRLARAELVIVLEESIKRHDIARKRLYTLMLNLATKGENDIASREKFVKRLGRLSSQGYIGLLRAKVYCLTAKEAGVRWILEDERTLNYLNLDHVSLLLSNVGKNKLRYLKGGRKDRYE